MPSFRNLERMTIQRTEHVGIELTKSHAPSGRGGDRHAPANTRASALSRSPAIVANASLRARGAELVARWSATKKAIGPVTSTTVPTRHAAPAMRRAGRG